MLCKICETRRARRFCPGVRGEICTLCCGTEREMTVDCPLDCEYLQDARKHERVAEPDPRNFPNPEIRVTENFLRENESFLVFLGHEILEAALSTPGAVDYDVREALDALVRTYRTFESGLIYETRPANPIAAAISRQIQAAIADFRRRERERGMAKTRDTDVLGVLAFLQRLEISNNNGRKRGRAFIDFLRGYFRDEQGQMIADPRASSLIVP